MFIRQNELKSFELAEGITSKILAHNHSLMMIENYFEHGAVAATHQHENEQSGYILSGCFEFIINDTVKILEQGDSFVVEKNVPHSCRALSSGVVLDIFTPLREDLLIRSKSL